MIIAVANPGLTFLVLSFSLAKLAYFSLMPEIQNVWENYLHGSPPSALELDLMHPIAEECALSNPVAFYSQLSKKEATQATLTEFQELAEAELL